MLFRSTLDLAIGSSYFNPGMNTREGVLLLGYFTLGAQIHCYNGIKIGDGQEILKHDSQTTTWDPASLNDGDMTSKTISVPVSLVGDTVTVGFSNAVPAGAILSGAVTAAGTVTVTLFNKTGGVLDLLSGTLRADVWQH